MKKYKEPEISFISLKPAENVANPCWSYVNNPDKCPTYYYDLPGAGSLEFRIIEGNKGGCDSGVPTDVYYVIDANQDGTISSDERRIATAAEYKTLYDAMHIKHEIGNGNSGENTNSSSFNPGDLPGGWS